MTRKTALQSLFLILFFVLVTFLTFNKHSKSGYFNYHSELWSDKAGYYIYLPATFSYQFDPNLCPDSIGIKTGNGFFLDFENSKIHTKYTYGIALLQLPFYLCAEALSPFISAENEPQGFTQLHHWAINLASSTYLVLGLFMLYLCFKSRYKQWVVILSLASIFFGTNLYFYTLNESGMSHVYSFFLFCSFIYLLKKTHFLESKNIFTIFLFGLICGVIIVIRPTNLIFITSFFFLDTKSTAEIVSRFKSFFQLKTLALSSIGFGLAILPQLIYWKYESGNLIHYSYNEEGFNFLNPQLLKMYFSPLNGLIIYTPFFIVVVISIALFFKHKPAEGWGQVILLIILSYVLSSWWCWWYGCALGARSFVEYYALFSIPLVYFYDYISKLKPLNYSVIIVFVLLCIMINLKLTYTYSHLNLA